MACSTTAWGTVATSSAQVLNVARKPWAVIGRPLLGSSHFFSPEFITWMRWISRPSVWGSGLDLLAPPGRFFWRCLYLGFEGRHLAGAILARTLWLQGHPAQAAGRARETVRDAASIE